MIVQRGRQWLNRMGENNISNELIGRSSPLLQILPVKFHMLKMGTPVTSRDRKSVV